MTALATPKQRATADRAALEQERRSELQLSYSDLATEEGHLILDAIWVSNPAATPEGIAAGLPGGRAGR